MNGPVAGPSGADGNRDPIEDARDLVEQLFPMARWAVVTGSVVTAQRTSGSDLDIVVVLPDGRGRRHGSLAGAS